MAAWRLVAGDHDGRSFDQLLVGGWQVRRSPAGQPPAASPSHRPRTPPHPTQHTANSSFTRGFCHRRPGRAGLSLTRSPGPASARGHRASESHGHGMRAPALAPACCCPRYALLPVQVRAQVPGRRAAHTKSMARGREPGQESGGPGGGLRFDWREEPCGGPCRPGRSSRRRAPALE